jgi:RNA polymerase sigma-70 factor (ECF subfamily)
VRDGALSEAFLTRFSGGPPPVFPDLEHTLRQLWEKARAAWPEIGLDPQEFAACLGECVSGSEDPRKELETLRIEELYLAHACVLGVPEALRTVEERFLNRVSIYVGHMRLAAPDIDEVRQLLSEKLLLRAPGVTPRIAQYRGKGVLEGWIRVAAIRVALDLRRRSQPRQEGLADALAAHGDPELAYIKERYRSDFETAVTKALAELSEADRNLLRFRFVDDLTPGSIGSIYGIHRTTTMRRLSVAKENLFTRIRAHLIERLRTTPEECESLIALLKSRLDASLPALLRTPPP